MVFGIHLTYGINDNALFINDICGTQRTFSHFAVHFFLTPSLVGFQDGQVGIGDEMERQVIFGDKVLVRLGAITANAQHVIAQC